ncbi:protein-tyrosine phosphatase-like protein [Blyttiomyces helicus]|uniref:Protein-tyrosine phosphatase-like protein n=1 Tax=Blyttiomyces helicus TaxID=388810 RepID=A0A4P9WJI2_9FUNG|nr:protein-tyrosine phosphatase-like protein [Blyttiomyces helicus]|eukprot:RKO92215.1 protein-tyrosine phosphatase-like protein [Blyttiomyces helicus]
MAPIASTHPSPASPPPAPTSASQGPLPHTIGDFSQMVWEQNTEVLVMLTREDERGRPRCAPYWPPNRASPLEFPALRGLVVTLLDESHMNSQETVLRKLSISLSRDSDIPPCIVWHVHFLALPDPRGSDPQNVLGVVALARSLQAPTAGPMLVHCSAGCGAPAPSAQSTPSSPSTNAPANPSTTPTPTQSPQPSLHSENIASIWCRPSSSTLFAKRLCCAGSSSGSAPAWIARIGTFAGSRSNCERVRVRDGLR